MEGEEAMKAHNVVESLELMYMCDAMKEKKHLKIWLVCFRATQCPAVTDLRWPIV